MNLDFRNYVASSAPVPENARLAGNGQGGDLRCFAVRADPSGMDGTCIDPENEKWLWASVLLDQVPDGLTEGEVILKCPHMVVLLLPFEREPRWSELYS